jgi:aminopeptidase-like protein
VKKKLEEEIAMKQVKNNFVGDIMFGWAKDLFPMNRSLTGSGVRETLIYLQEIIPNLSIKEVKSGTKAFDWEVPEEWNVSDGYIEDLNGNKLISFLDNNLHVMGYSTPVDKILTKNELNEHIFTLPNQPNAIPYVTSYYKREWGFCMSHKQKLNLGSGPFHVVIKSELFKGSLSYGELVIPGKSRKEIMFTTNICHPSLANNELSGPVILTALAKWIEDYSDRKFTYRILFLPETIGAIYYISRNLRYLKRNLQAGWVLTCLGDDNKFSFIPSRTGDSNSDRVSRVVLDGLKEFREYTWLERGSDERQFCAPGIDLPVSSITRSKYGEYPEYHTSLDNLNFISPVALEGSLEIFKKIVKIMENNRFYKINIKCEPQLSKRNLYPSISIKNDNPSLRNQMNVISYLDGKHDLIDIAHKCKLDFFYINELVLNLKTHKLISEERK